MAREGGEESRGQALAPSLDPDKQEQARSYARLQRRLSFLELGAGAAALLALILSGASTALRDALPLPQSARVASYLAVLVLGYGLLTFPLTYYAGFILPRRYKLLRQALPAWLGDMAKGGALGLLLGVGVVVMLYLFLGTVPGLWWLPATGLMLLLTVVLTRLAPVLILPLFFKLEPLADDGLKDRLLALGRRAGAQASGVYVMNLSAKTTGANALLAGLGSTRRIILGDTLMEGYSPDEIEAVLAHELGHHLRRDIPRLITLQSAFTLLTFYLVALALARATPLLGLSGVSDVAGLPLLGLLLGAISFGLRPLSNAYSRRLETAADKLALDLTGNPRAFATMLTRLTDQNLSEAHPPRWVEVLFYDHPPYYKRVARALAHLGDR